jgi:hypothetical protein
LLFEKLFERKTLKNHVSSAKFTTFARSKVEHYIELQKTIRLQFLSLLNKVINCWVLFALVRGVGRVWPILTLNSTMTLLPYQAPPQASLLGVRISQTLAAL